MLTAVAVGVLMAAAAGLQLVRERTAALSNQHEETLYLTSGKALRAITIGYAALAADVYWIRAIQHFGGKHVGRTSDFPLLYPLLDLTTTLDPRFSIAYRFGSIFLGEPSPGGAGRPDLAIALLQKGIREMPDKWEYVVDIGFVHYWWRHDYVEAAAWFERASHLPKAPSWLPSMAATTLARGGDRASSRRMWEALRESADNDWLRGSADRALMQLRALDEMDQLQQVVNRMAANGGAFRITGQVAQINGRVIVDPTGVPYEVDTAGRVHLGKQSTLAPLPTQAGSQNAPVS